MLKALLRVRMTALGKWFTGATAKKGKQTKGSMIGFAFLMVYAFGAAGFGIWHLFDVLAAPFHAVGLDWLVYAMAVMMDFGLMFTMLISWAALIPPIVLYAACDVDFNICAWGFAAAIAAADILLYHWLMSRGAEIYAAL